MEAQPIAGEPSLCGRYTFFLLQEDVGGIACSHCRELVCLPVLFEEVE